MQRRAVYDVSDFPRLEPSRKAPIWWGIVGLILVESSVIAGFIATYFYLVIQNEAWPPPQVEPSPLLLPTLALVLLLASCGTMAWAGRMAARGRNTPFVSGVFASAFLAALVLVVRWLQFQAFEFRWDEHAYGSIMWTITGFHSTHVVSALIGIVVVGILGLRGFFSPRRRIGVIVYALYWYFVGLAGIPLYVVLYWVPRWL